MESNLRDAIEFLVNLGDENSEPKVIEINGKTYCTKNLRRYDEKPKADAIEGASLTALLDYIIDNQQEMPDGKMIVHSGQSTQTVADDEEQRIRTDRAKRARDQEVGNVDAGDENIQSFLKAIKPDKEDLDSIFDESSDEDGTETQEDSKV